MGRKELKLHFVTLLQYYMYWYMYIHISLHFLILCPSPVVSAGGRYNWVDLHEAGIQVISATLKGT